MTLHGHIQNGMIILDDHVPLPDGAPVEVRVLAPRLSENSATDVESGPTLAERLKDFIGILDNLPEDAAKNHDHYLYGAPTQRCWK